MNDIQQKTFDRALRFLGTRAHGSMELRRKLERNKELSAADLDIVIAECHRLNLLNDALFAENYAQELAQRGSGSRRIRQMLKQKGLDNDDISAALSAFADPDDEVTRAVAAGSRKLRSLKSDPTKKKLQLLRFLSARGFSAPAVYEATRRLLNAAEGLE